MKETVCGAMASTVHQLTVLLARSSFRTSLWSSMDTYVVDGPETVSTYPTEEISTEEYSYGYAYPKPRTVVTDERLEYHEDEPVYDTVIPAEVGGEEEDESFQYHEEWSEVPEGWEGDGEADKQEVRIELEDYSADDYADVWMPSEEFGEGGGLLGADIFVGIGDAGEMYERWCELQPWECQLNGTAPAASLLLPADFVRLWGSYDASGILLALLLLVLLLLGLNIGWDSEVCPTLASDGGAKTRS